MIWYSMNRSSNVWLSLYGRGSCFNIFNSDSSMSSSLCFWCIIWCILKLLEPGISPSEMTEKSHSNTGCLSIVQHTGRLCSNAIGISCWKDILMTTLLRSWLCAHPVSMESCKSPISWGLIRAKRKKNCRYRRIGLTRSNLWHRHRKAANISHWVK